MPHIDVNELVAMLDYWEEIVNHKGLEKFEKIVFLWNREKMGELLKTMPLESSLLEIKRREAIEEEISESHVYENFAVNEPNMPRFFFSFCRGMHAFHMHILRNNGANTRQALKKNRGHMAVIVSSSHIFNGRGGYN